MQEMTQAMTGLPAQIAARIARGDLAPAAERPARGETPEDVAERLGRAQEHHRARWMRHVPTEFATASLADLETNHETNQDPDGKVTRWLAEGGRTLVLRSDEPGLGKSHAAYAIGHLASDSGAWVAAWTMSRLNDALRPGGDETALEVASECDLLIIDELGAEKISEWTVDRLNAILDARWSNRRRTIITTNLSGDDFIDRYGDRILDRINDDKWIATFTGESRRVERKAPW